MASASAPVDSREWVGPVLRATPMAVVAPVLGDVPVAPVAGTPVGEAVAGVVTVGVVEVGAMVVGGTAVAGIGGIVPGWAPAPGFVVAGAAVVAGVVEAPGTRADAGIGNAGVEFV